jgi:putative hydrolase of the HAD superfamily
MKIPKQPYKALLFDLGGVLVELVGMPRMMELTCHRFTEPELWRQWILSPTIRLFESGILTVNEFGERIVAEFGMDILPSRYLDEFTAWPTGKYPGTDSLLMSLKPDITIASLSNTNELHWARMVNEMHFIHLFDYNFPSHLTTCLKPDIETYLCAARQMGVKPQETLFFDDNRLNVDGAKKAGMDAVEVHGVEEVKEHLAAIGIAVA